MLLSAAEGRATLADVLPNCVASLRGERGSLELPPARSAIVLLADGLGASLLRARAGHARQLTRDWDERSETACSFPSTTVAGITSLTTGTSAGEHGLLGYSLYDRAAGVVRNQLHGWGPGMEPRSWQPVPTVFERVGEQLRCLVVGSPAYKDTGLTAASLRGAGYVPAAGMMDRVQAALAAVHDARPALVYLYVAEIDQAGHKHGTDSGEWVAALEELDAACRALEAGLPADCGLLITADHGMLDVPFEQQAEMPADGPLAESIIAIAGEPRLRHLYARDDASPEEVARIAERWRAAEGERAVVLTGREAIAAGWYGPRERVSAAAAARIGDVIVAATGDVGYYPQDVPPQARLVPGQHGSITPQETIVPLIRRGAFRAG